MTAYRDQYAKLFNNGEGVKVLGISVDPDTTLASWAKEQDFPITFLSDTGAVVGKQYGVAVQTRIGLLDSRIVYVLDKDGKIAHVMAPFREMEPPAYDSLAAAVARVSAQK
mgnify:CR=1 FL=1